MRQAGFSAVELLITLFVAALFVATGYQLYTSIIKTGADARQRAIASNIAYDNLRRYVPQAPNPCATTTPSPTPSIPAGTLPNQSITVTIDCPYGVGATTTRVLVKVFYGTPQQEVDHAIFVNN